MRAQAVDVTEPDQTEAMVADKVAVYGRLEVIVNYAAALDQNGRD